MPENDVKIIKPEFSLNKKLGKIKFDQVFDKSTLESAEKSVAAQEKAFKTEATNDFNKLKSIFENLTADNFNSDLCLDISELAFSIKSRASTGGLPLASEIASSMYKFSDAACVATPDKAYTVLKLHFDALADVFNSANPAYDEITSKKLIKGLEDVAHKFLDKK